VVRKVHVYIEIFIHFNRIYSLVKNNAMGREAFKKEVASFNYSKY
jgi:hypothetical protein